jgi:hypothetical protein
MNDHIMAIFKRYDYYDFIRGGLRLSVFSEYKIKQPKICQNCIWGNWDGLKQFCSKQTCIKEIPPLMVNNSYAVTYPIDVSTRA